MFRLRGYTHPDWFSFKQEQIQHRVHEDFSTATWLAKNVEKSPRATPVPGVYETRDLFQSVVTGKFFKFASCREANETSEYKPVFCLLYDILLILSSQHCEVRIRLSKASMYTVTKSTTSSAISVAVASLCELTGVV